MHSRDGLIWSLETIIAVTPTLSRLVEGDVADHKMPSVSKIHPQQQCGSTEQKSCLARMLKKKNNKKEWKVKKPIY